MKLNLTLKAGDDKFLDLDNQSLQDGKLRVDKAITLDALKKAADDDGNVRITAIVS